MRRGQDCLKDQQTDYYDPNIDQCEHSERSNEEDGFRIFESPARLWTAQTQRRTISFRLPWPGEIELGLCLWIPGGGQAGKPAGWISDREDQWVDFPASQGSGTLSLAVLVWCA